MLARLLGWGVIGGILLFPTLLAGQEAENRMAVIGQRVAPGQRDARFPVLATSAEPIQGFQVMATFDPDVLTPAGAIFAPPVSRLEPEFQQTNVFGDRIEIGTLFDFLPPFDGRTLPPLHKTPVAILRFDVAKAAAIGTRTTIDLVNDVEISRIFNIFTVDGFSVIPDISSGIVDVTDGTVFLRGDVDSNGEIDVTDAVVLLNWLFLSGVAPACDDAADFDDSGSVDLSKAVTLLNYLFLSGPLPAAPYPVVGLDQTEDDLSCR